jgi:hypothetical protein
MPKKERRRGPVAYVAGPLVLAAALAFESAAHPVEARAVDTMDIRPPQSAAPDLYAHSIVNPRASPPNLAREQFTLRELRTVPNRCWRR